MASILSFALCIKLVKVFVRNFPVWLSTPINNPQNLGPDQQNKKAYGDPPDPFSTVTKQKRKKAVWGRD